MIFNSSVSAYFTTRGILAYGSAKAALLSLTAALSRELAPRGIRVNCLAPATTRTRMAGVLYRADHEKHAVVHSERVWLLPRIAEPEEVAGGAAYLASGDSSFVSGSCPSVNPSDGRSRRNTLDRGRHPLPSVSRRKPFSCSLNPPLYKWL